MNVEAVLTWLVIGLLSLIVGLLGVILKMHKESDDERLKRIECDLRIIRRHLGWDK